MGRKCSQCGITKALSQFYADKSHRGGYATECKECHAVRAKRNSAKNPHRAKELGREYRRTHKEELVAIRHNRYIKNKSQIDKWNKDWASRNIIRLKEWYKKYRKDHASEWSSTRRARKGNNGGNFTSKEWQELRERYGNKCLRCGSLDKITADHVVPLFVGGSNSIENIQPLCRSCNASKGIKTIDYR